MTTLFERQQRIDNLLADVFTAWENCSIDPCPPEAKPILAKAFEGNLYKRKFRPLSKPPSWLGFKTGNQTDQKALAQCIANVLGSMWEWHRSGGGAWTGINASFRAKLLEEELAIPGFRDAIENFAILVLHLTGARFTAVKAWEKQLAGLAPKA